MHLSTIMDADETGEATADALVDIAASLASIAAGLANAAELAGVNVAEAFKIHRMELGLLDPTDPREL